MRLPFDRAAIPIQLAHSAAAAATYFIKFWTMATSSRWGQGTAVRMKQIGNRKWRAIESPPALVTSKARLAAVRTARLHETTLQSGVASRISHTIERKNRAANRQIVVPAGGGSAAG